MTTALGMTGYLSDWSQLIFGSIPYPLLWLARHSEAGAVVAEVHYAKSRIFGLDNPFLSIQIAAAIIRSRLHNEC